MSDKTIASLATMPSRIHSLRQMIPTILDQVDELHVYLNQYSDIPNTLKQAKIKYYFGKQHRDLADTGKFYPLMNKQGYLFTLDDDLLYPSDYVKQMITKIESYHRQSFICVHANNIPPKKLNSYYKEKKGIHYEKKLDHDQIVQIPGTGTMSFHSSLYQVSLKDFPIPLMTDIWMGKVAKERSIPIIALARKSHWINAIKQTESNSIRNYFEKSDYLPTLVVNNINFSAR